MQAKNEITIKEAFCALEKSVGYAFLTEEARKHAFLSLHASEASPTQIAFFRYALIFGLESQLGEVLSEEQIDRITNQESSLKYAKVLGLERFAPMEGLESKRKMEILHTLLQNVVHAINVDSGYSSILVVKWMFSSRLLTEALKVAKIAKVEAEPNHNNTLFPPFIPANAPSFVTQEEQDYSNIASSSSHISPKNGIQHICQLKFGGGLPMYSSKSFGELHRLSFISTVTLPDGQTFEGSPCSSRKESESSAAKKALHSFQRPR